jgi:hypothetical protein
MKKDKEHILSRTELFFVGVITGSIVGNALVYFLIDYFI